MIATDRIWIARFAALTYAGGCTLHLPHLDQTGSSLIWSNDDEQIRNLKLQGVKSGNH